MRMASTIVLLFFGLSPILAQSTIAKPEAKPVTGTIDWVYDYEEGKELSRSTGKPMFVVFRCER